MAKEMINGLEVSVFRHPSNVHTYGLINATMEDVSKLYDYVVNAYNTVEDNFVTSWYDGKCNGYFTCKQV